LVVDYLGLAEELKQALADYTNSKGKGDITLDQGEAVAVMLERYERVCAILHGFEYEAAAEATAAKRLPLIAQAAEHVLQQKDGKQRYLQAVSDLSKAFALAVPHDSALEIRDEVGSFRKSGRCWPRASAKAAGNRRKNWRPPSGKLFPAPFLRTR